MPADLLTVQYSTLRIKQDLTVLITALQHTVSVTTYMPCHQAQTQAKRNHTLVIEN